VIKQDSNVSDESSRTVGIGRGPLVESLSSSSSFVLETSFVVGEDGEDGVDSSVVVYVFDGLETSDEEIEVSRDDVVGGESQVEAFSSFDGDSGESEVASDVAVEEGEVVG